MTDQPVRHTADTITDDQLDELYARAEQAESERDKACLAFNAKVIALGTAEDVIARARKLADDWAVLRTHGSAAYELRAALDQPKEPAP